MDMKIDPKEMALDTLHYMVLLAFVVLFWPIVLGYFNGDIIFTSLTVFIIFVIVDKIEHYLIGE